MHRAVLEGFLKKDGTNGRVAAIILVIYQSFGGYIIVFQLPY